VGEVFMGENKLISDQGKKGVNYKREILHSCENLAIFHLGSSPYVVDNCIPPQIPLEAKQYTWDKVE
jgi:hypothetical protein